MKSPFEIDDAPHMEAHFDYDARQYPPEPDVGIFRPYWELDNGQITGGRIGGLDLDRAQMIAAFGADEIERLEEAEQVRLEAAYAAPGSQEQAA